MTTKNKNGSSKTKITDSKSKTVTAKKGARDFEKDTSATAKALGKAYRITSERIHKEKPARAEG